MFAHETGKRGKYSETAGFENGGVVTACPYLNIAWVSGQPVLPVSYSKLDSIWNNARQYAAEHLLRVGSSPSRL